MTFQFGGLDLQTLQKMRGVDDVSLEFEKISANAEETRQESLWGSAQTLYSKAHYKQAMAACLIPFFQQFTGMNAIMFYGAHRTLRSTHLLDMSCLYHRGYFAHFISIVR
jgi:hypothetical protein